MSFFTYTDFARPWQVSFQKPATTMMEGIIDLHHDIFTFLVVILIFVSFVLGTILYRYLEANQWTIGTRLPLMQFQTGHGITHDTVLEIVWTIIPTLVLLFIATPTFALIYALDEIVEPELTLRVVGRQWYWTYEYPDTVNHKITLSGGDFTSELVPVELSHSILGMLLRQNAANTQDVVSNLSQPLVTTLKVPGFSFNSYIVPTEDLFPGSFRLLEVDRRVVLPVNTNIRVLVTSYDVIHSWAVPAFGIKVDALPGRLNEYFLNINYLGIFYGQCSEICGVNHGFMPIKVEAVTEQQFVWWFLQTSLIENPPVKFRQLFSDLVGPYRIFHQDQETPYVLPLVTPKAIV